MKDRKRAYFLGILLVWTLFMIGCGANPGETTGESAAKNTYLQISAEEAANMMVTENNYVILDVRTGHPQLYNLGECEFHLAFAADDFEAAHKLHEEMGCICFENPEMGIYFILDPDGNWLEIVPSRKK